MKISILIPTKDEPLIDQLVKRINELVKQRHEIIVIDKSKFPPKLKGAKLVRQKSDGLGNAILEGLRYSKGEIVVIMDGDFSHRPKDLVKLLKKVEEYDIVIGSRYVKGGEDKRKSFLRKSLSILICQIISLIFRLGIKDPLSGFLVMKKKVINSIRLHPIGFKIGVEILVRGKKFSRVEIPIIFDDRKKGRSKFGLTEIMRFILYVIKLKLGQFLSNSYN